MGEKTSIVTYSTAVQTIKTAILQGQYEAAKETNRIQLALYYGIGRYLSLHTRKGVWGQGALKSISEQLQKELPGLRGFGETQMKKMRLFYDEWSILDANLPITIGEIQQSTNSSLVKDELQVVEYEDYVNSSLTSDELQVVDEQINLNSLIMTNELKDFPIEDFFRVPFTHHFYIASSTLSLPERYYYIHRTAEELRAVMMRGE